MSNTQSNANRTAALNPLSTADARNLLENIYKHSEQYHIKIDKYDTLIAYDLKEDCFYKCTHHDVWYVMDPIHELVDNLDSENGTDAALSANQGRVIKEWIERNYKEFEEFKHEVALEFGRVDKDLEALGVRIDTTNENLATLDARVTTEVETLNERITKEVTDVKEWTEEQIDILGETKANKDLTNVTDTDFHDKGVASKLWDHVKRAPQSFTFGGSKRLPLPRIGFDLNSNVGDDASLILNKSDLNHNAYFSIEYFIPRGESRINSGIGVLDNISLNMKMKWIDPEPNANVRFRVYSYYEGYDPEEDFYQIDGMQMVMFSDNDIFYVQHVAPIPVNDLETPDQEYVVEVSIPIRNIYLKNPIPVNTNVKHMITCEMYGTGVSINPIGQYNRYPGINIRRQYFPYSMDIIDKTFTHGSISQYDFNRITDRAIYDLDINKINTSQRNVANGFAGLNQDVKIDISLLPDFIKSGMMYGGIIIDYDVYNNTKRAVAETSTAYRDKFNWPHNVAITSNNAAQHDGVYFISKVSGVLDDIDDINPGDWIISNGTAWAKIDNTDNVASVAGRKGVVILTKTDVGLSNVDNTADSTKRVLYAATAGSASASDVHDWAKATTKPAYGVSEISGAVANTDLRLTNSRSASDVFEWAKAATKPSYSASDVGALSTMSNNIQSFHTTTVESGFIFKVDGVTKGHAGSTSLFTYLYNESTTKYLKNCNDGALRFGTGWAQSGDVVYHSGSMQPTLPATYAASNNQQPPNYFGMNRLGALMSNVSINTNVDFKNWIYVDAYNGNDVGGATAIGVSRISPRMFIMQSNANRTAWNNSAEVYTTHNLKAPSVSSVANTLVQRNGNSDIYVNIARCANVSFTSDRRLKSNISNIVDRNIARIETKSYIKNDQFEIGYIAQDVQSIAPQFVSEDDTDDKMLSLNYTSIFAAKIAILEDTVKDLNDKLNGLR